MGHFGLDPKLLSLQHRLHPVYVLQSCAAPGFGFTEPGMQVPVEDVWIALEGRMRFSPAVCWGQARPAGLRRATGLVEGFIHPGSPAGMLNKNEDNGPTQVRIIRYVIYCRS